VIPAQGHLHCSFITNRAKSRSVAPEKNCIPRPVGSGRPRDGPMAITRIDFDQIGQPDLHDLMERQVEEGVFLDYKAALYDASNDGKKEFLKDVSSFSNTGGGHIIVGIPEREGAPVSVDGIDADLDAAMLRLESLLRDCVEPRIIGIRMRPVQLANGRRVLVIRIPKSWNPPHAVLQNKARLIFVRNSAGVHEASVDEMRTMFTTAAALLDRAREFQRQRLIEIHTGEGPGPIPLGGEGGRIALHVVPFSAFGTEGSVDPRRAAETPLIPMWCTGCDFGFNVDGYWTKSGGAGRSGYVQVFRNGIIESVAGDVRQQTGRGRLLSAEEVEDHIVTHLVRCITVLARMGVTPPLLVMLSGARMHETTVVGSNGIGFNRIIAQPLRKSDVFFPTITIEEFGTEENYRRSLKPIFDAVWNAAGYGASQSYDHEGNWVRVT
jgi:hypothetical protein